MSIKLNEARRKKADELGLPYRLENECVIHKDGWQVAEPRTLGEYPLLFMMESANRVLQLEQAVETLMAAGNELLEVARLRVDNDSPHPSNDNKLWTARMQTAWDEFEEALAETEPDHE